MSEKIDIVRRLRLEVNAMGEFSTYASREYCRLLTDSANEIEQLRKQLDKARRLICQTQDRERGWDCHKDYK